MTHLDLNQSRILANHAQIMTAVYDRLNNFHKEPLHAGQIQLAKAYFTERKELFSRSGVGLEEKLVPLSS